MDPAYLVSLAEEVLVSRCGDIFFHLLVPIKHCFNALTNLSVVAILKKKKKISITTFASCFQQDNTPCHKTQIILNWLLEHDNEFTILKKLPQSPDLSPIEELCDVLE